MTIETRFGQILGRFEKLKALGRDPSTLTFSEMISPTEAMLEGRRVILFGTNNYLGLTFDPACIEANVDATRAAGVGTTGSRIANGTYNEHRALERRVAEFYNKREAVVFSTGYTANLGVICGLAGRGDHILIDADSHASIYDACRMSGAEIIRFRHNSASDIEKKLSRLRGREGIRLVVVEGIYSMLGDMAPLADIAAVTRAAGPNVYLMVDEAHSLGVMGENGRGKAEADGVEDDCHFIVGTFSKSIGTIGGYCVSNVEGFGAIRMLSRPYMFTASMTPGVVAAAKTGFDRMVAQPERRAALWRNANAVHGALAEMGYDVEPEASPIIAVKLPDKESAVLMWNALIDAGLYSNIAIPPATPNALSLLRVSLSAAHTPSTIARALDIFRSVGERLGVIGPGPRLAPRSLSEAAPAARAATQPTVRRARASGVATG